MQSFHISYLRAVAYRWIARWTFGYLGWDNARPLSACIYEHIRKAYAANYKTGFVPSANRR